MELFVFMVFMRGRFLMFCYLPDVGDRVVALILVLGLGEMVEILVEFPATVLQQKDTFNPYTI